VIRITPHNVLWPVVHIPPFPIRRSSSTYAKVTVLIRIALIGSEVLTVVVMKNLYSEIQCHVLQWKSAEVLEDHVTSIFRVEE
jgi:hypothetical protein